MQSISNKKMAEIMT